MVIRTHIAKIASPAVTAGVLLLLSSAAHAAVFIGQSISVAYDGSDFGPLSDTIVAGTNDPDIEYGDSTAIGGSLMLDFESIDFSDTSILFTLRGDGTDYPYSGSGYQTTGLNGRYVISLTSTNLVIDSLSLANLSDVIDVALDDDITFDARHGYFDLSDFGILEVNGADLGTIELSASLSEVPIPAALPLLLSGLGIILLSARRKKPASS